MIKAAMVDDAFGENVKVIEPCMILLQQQGNSFNFCFSHNKAMYCFVPCKDELI